MALSARGRHCIIKLRSNTTGALESHSFGRAVVCAGPWTAKLVPELSAFLSTLRTPVTYWHDPSGSHSASNVFPIIFNARLTGIYGLPSLEYPGLVDRLVDNVVVGCRFSGSGFKHSPATGKMLAALALDREETIPQGFRSDRYLLHRFQKQ